jgi:hypothetical protein
VSVPAGVSVPLLFSLLVAALLLPVEGGAFPREYFGGAAFGVSGAVSTLPSGLAAINTNPAYLGLIEKFETGLFYGSFRLEDDALMSRYRDIRFTPPALLDPVGDPDSAADLASHLRKLGQGRPLLRGGEHTGMGLSFRGFTITAIRYEYMEAAPAVDRAHLGITAADQDDSILHNATTIELRGLEFTEITLAYARPMGPVLLGGTTRYISAKTYWNSVSPFGTEYSADDFFKKSLSAHDAGSSTVTGDIGFLINAGMMLFGGVVHNVNKGRLSTADRGNYRLERRYRLGLALTPTPDLRVTVDYDVVGYDSPLLDREIQEVAVGAVISIGQYWQLRTGLSKNLKAGDPNFRYGAGIGFKLTRVAFDAGYLFTEIPNSPSIALNLRVFFGEKATKKKPPGSPRY